MAKRLNMVVRECADCPYTIWVGGMMWLCSATRTQDGAPPPVRERAPSTIPSWCPLPDDVPPPAQALISVADLAEIIRQANQAKKEQAE